MGQKVNPIGLRLGIVRGWESNWYGGKEFGEKLAEDNKIRKYLNARMPRAGISKILIERMLKRVIITVHTSRPGIVIGKGGSEVDKLKEEIEILRKGNETYEDLLAGKDGIIEEDTENIVKDVVNDIIDEVLDKSLP